MAQTLQVTGQTDDKQENVIDTTILTAGTLAQSLYALSP